MSVEPGFPVTIIGPSTGDGTPVAYQLWDARGNLLCSREPAANPKWDPNIEAPAWCRAKTGGGPEPTAYNGGAGNDATGDILFQSEYVYESRFPHRLKKSVGPA